MFSHPSKPAPAVTPAVTSPTQPTMGTTSQKSPLYPDEKSQSRNSNDHITISVLPTASSSRPENPLSIFHNALGIPPPKPIPTPKPTKGNPAPTPPPQPLLTPANRGVYPQVLSCERRARYKYFITDAIITLAMFLQIIVGASVTAFGAGSASHILVTIFGAANTALASLLAVLKSQGLPNRIRQDWNGWRELREFIEEKEREIEMVVSGKVARRVEELDVWETVRMIEMRYSAVRLTMEANRPDTYIKVPGIASLPK